ncbi:ABC transporter permease [Paenibacillus antibioticophila]|uniref:ABC transporter permease n=1 Tax=Paenibacillus antibioticophila TaxID=1274374 RepID=A0A919XVL2_9BACL|nr:carbohydrate ABC transporter permease [Paenibacillus antibioticophila]GIO37695.1 ABC transporter permease [Paenibacillus antibioticophila]
MSKKIKWGKLLTTAVLGLLSLCFLLPLVWMLSAASKIEKDVWTFPIQWIPETWNFVNNFKEVWMGKVPFHMFYVNSIKIALITTLATLIVSSMAGYAFSKIQFTGKHLLFGLLLSFMMIPEQSTLVPRYLLIKWFGLYNTHTAIILLLMFSIYFTFLFRQYMMGIHDDMLEAAQLDGAGYFKIYWKVMIPLSKPIIATVGIIKFIWTWNDYQTPLIFLMTKEKFPIPLGIQFFKEEFATNISVMMMASLSAIIPLILIFLFLQKQVIEGIALGGVKG